MKPAKKHCGNNKKIWIWLLALMLVWLAGAAGCAQQEAAVEDLPAETQVATAAPAPTPTATPTPAPTAAPTPEPPPFDGIRPPDREIDFDELEALNEDIFAWIEIPGTGIDYPVLVSEDNLDYLYANEAGEEDVNGAIFIDMLNDADLLDRNTLIYGHNMKNGSMFAGLHQFEEPEFFAENGIVKVYAPEGLRIYDIIAAYKTDDRHIPAAYDFADDDVWAEYVDGIFENEDDAANIRDNADAVAEDVRMITLSTCVSGEDDKRYLVQAVLNMERDGEENAV